jgi:hypothetical protein
LSPEEAPRVRKETIQENKLCVILSTSFPHRSTPVVQTTLAMPVATDKERLSQL